MVQLEDTTYQEILRSQKSRDDENLRLKAENQWLKEQLGLVKRKLYSPSSEQSPVGQEEMLFNEAEACASPTLPDPETESITYTRRKTAGKRERDVSNLPVEERNYDLPEEEKICSECDGPLHNMGVDTSQEIKIIPAQVILVKHNRTKYACRNCERNEIKTPIVSASMPKSAFPNSLASASAVAYIISQKYVEGMPLYRQEQNLARLGFALSRQTMANWTIVGADWLEQITRRMKAHLLSYDILHADETPLQVLKEQGRRPQQTSYMWLYQSGRDGPPIVLYEYQETRGAEHPCKFLKGFSGYLHVDAYQVYEKLNGVKLVGCWAHARRNFIEALAILSPMTREKADTAARVGHEFCNKLFKIERELQEKTPEERLEGRLEHSALVLVEFHAWLERMRTSVTPKCPTGKAIGYCLNQWSKLTEFMTDGRLELTNNRAERAIKSFVIGRKNWLFADTPRGADASATCYSIIETAKANGLNPLNYMTYLFETLPNMNWKDPEALDALMPWNETIQARFRVRTTSTK